MNPTVFDGTVEVVHDILPPRQLIAHFLAEQGNLDLLSVAVRVASVLRAIARDGNIHILHALRVNAHANGRSRLAVCLMELVSDRFQLRFEPVERSESAEVVLREPTATLVAEMADENLGERPQQVVACGEAVLAVNMPHAVEVDVCERRRLALLDKPISGDFSKLEEIGHARQAGEGIVREAPILALLVKKLAVIPVQDALVCAIGVGVAAFVEIPDGGELHARFRSVMLSVRVHDAISAADLDPVNGIVAVLAGCELHRHFADPRNVVGVQVAIQIGFHEAVRLFGIGVAEHLAKAGRYRHDNHTLVDQLVYRIRNGGCLYEGQLLATVLVPLHMIPYHTPKWLTIKQYFKCD